jgi:hypothetical protein
MIMSQEPRAGKLDLGKKLFEKKMIAGMKKPYKMACN